MSLRDPIENRGVAIPGLLQSLRSLAMTANSEAKLRHEKWHSKECPTNGWSVALQGDGKVAP